MWQVEEPLDESWIDQLEQPLGEAVKLPESIIFLGRTQVVTTCHKYINFFSEIFLSSRVGRLCSCTKVHLKTRIAFVGDTSSWWWTTGVTMCADMQERCQKEGGFGVESVLRAG